MIDGGSTTRAFAQALAAKELHITVVTNCLPVARALRRIRTVRTLICPGNYVAREEGTYGADALEYLRRFNANKAFIGAGGVTPQGVSRPPIPTAARSSAQWRSERTRHSARR
jgi:DeoR/GlpR family transcriptional regulator of sugar metabolism